MSDIAADLVTYLKTISAVTDIVGTGASAKIYEEDPKQAVAMPYIVFTVVPGVSHYHLGGLSGLATNEIQVDAYETTRALSFTLAEAIRLAPLAAFRGTLDTATVIEHGQNSYRRGRDKPTAAGNQARYWISRDYEFTYDEAIS